MSKVMFTFQCLPLNNAKGHIYVSVFAFEPCQRSRLYQLNRLVIKTSYVTSNMNIKLSIMEKIYRYPRLKFL